MAKPDDLKLYQEKAFVAESFETVEEVAQVLDAVGTISDRLSVLDGYFDDELNLDTNAAARVNDALAQVVFNCTAHLRSAVERAKLGHHRPPPVIRTR